jgi:hypothetical protein
MLSTLSVSTLSTLLLGKTIRRPRRPRCSRFKGIGPEHLTRERLGSNLNIMGALSTLPSDVRCSGTRCSPPYPLILEHLEHLGCEVGV